MKQRKAFLISGYSGAGKTALSEELMRVTDGHHIVFSRKLANSGTKTASVPRIIKNVFLHGLSQVSSDAVKKSMAEFVASGKTTLILDDVVSKRVVTELRRIAPDLKIRTVFVANPKKRRVVFASLRKKSKGGGSIARAKIWVSVMDILRNFPSVRNMRELKLESNIVVRNLGSLSKLKKSARKIAGK